MFQIWNHHSFLLYFIVNHCLVCIRNGFKCINYYIKCTNMYFNYFAFVMILFCFVAFCTILYKLYCVCVLFSSFFNQTFIDLQCTLKIYYLFWQRLLDYVHFMLCVHVHNVHWLLYKMNLKAFSHWHSF